jgi:exopolysaccharide biosynthesis predicted pyruvyltransferase EpsI
MALREVFEEFSNRKFIFVATGGNQGDLLIYQGAFKLADELGLNYKPVLASINWKAETFGKSKIIYLQGGGGFTPLWNWSPWLLRILREANPKNHIIIGPSSAGNRRYLDYALNMDDEMTFFARERTTFNIMQHYCDDVRLDHDTALNLNFGDGYLRRVVGKFEPRNGHDLLVLRQGAEAPTHIPSEIRQRDFGVVCDPVRKGDWGRLHMHARRIVANRSHSAILGAILGKDTTLFAGSYHKNRSIYDYSLKDLGVKWIE